MNFNFGEVLSRAWQIIWKHKVLWIFGIFAGCSRGSGSFRGNSGGSGGGGTGGQLPPELMRIFQVIQQNLVTFIVVGCILVLLIWAITIFLSTIGKVGLIRGTYQAEGGAEKLIFGQLFSESTPFFWRVFGLSLIIAIPLLVLFAALIAGFAAFAISASNGNDAARVGVFGFLPLLIGCVCLFVPVMFVVGMIIRQAENAIVLENMPVLPAISRGWEIFRANLGPYYFDGDYPGSGRRGGRTDHCHSDFGHCRSGRDYFCRQPSGKLDSHDLCRGLSLSLYSRGVVTQRNPDGLYRVSMDTHLHAPDR